MEGTPNEALVYDKYVWITLGWYRDNWWKVERTTDKVITNCTDEDVEQFLIRSVGIVQANEAENVNGETDVQLVRLYSHHITQYAHSPSPPTHTHTHISIECMTRYQLIHIHPLYRLLRSLKLSTKAFWRHLDMILKYQPSMPMILSGLLQEHSIGVS